MPRVVANPPTPLVEAIDRIAEREGKSRGRVIEDACERYATERGEWPPGGGDAGARRAERPPLDFDALRAIAKGKVKP